MTNLKKSFSKIYDQYINKIYRFIFLKVNSQEIAQDLCSETFLRTWKKFSQGKGNLIENPRAFLYQIARNLTIDYYREKGKAQVVSAELASIVDSRQNLEKEAIFMSDINMIRRVLTELRPDYQDVIIWHYLDDLSIQEVAKMLGRTEPTTRVLLHRALQTLRKKLD